MNFRNGIVVGDRYYYDLISGDYYSIPSVLKRVLLTVMPNPDVLILLTNQPEVIHQRKPELSCEAIGRQIQGVRALCSAMPGYREILTEGSVQDASARVIEEIVNAFATK